MDWWSIPLAQRGPGSGYIMKTQMGQAWVGIVIRISCIRTAIVRAMLPVTGNTRVIGGKRPVDLAKRELNLVMDFQKNPEQYQYRPGLPDQPGRNRGYRVIWPASSGLSGGSKPVDQQARAPISVMRAASHSSE